MTDKSSAFCYLSGQPLPVESLYGMDVDGVECCRVVVWHFIRPAEPLWGTALADRMRAGPAAATVLIAAQLATGRARRDAMQELYDSFPVSVATRTLAHLTALAAALAFARRDPFRPISLGRSPSWRR